jgi:uncharacterized protein (DUF433 family)
VSRKSTPEEALKERLMPGIAFRGDDDDRHAWLTGTDLDVRQVIEVYKHLGESFDRAIEETGLTERELRAARRYYGRFTQEIDDCIALENSTKG